MIVRIATVFFLLTALAHAQRADTPRPATRPTTRPATSQATTQPAFEILIDSSEVPEMKEWAQSLQPILDKWYPIIVQTFPSEGYTAPRKMTVTIKKQKTIAFASGTRIVCSAEWFTEHPDDRGAVVHELVHVAQQYRGRNPGWLVEGIADYLRWFKYEPLDKRPRARPGQRKYTVGYQQTGAFLEWLAANKDHEIVVKLNGAMRQGKYRPELWQEYTGKTVDELWDEYVESLRAK